MLKKEIQSFIVSNAQTAIDNEMMGSDIIGTKAHVVMLYETKIIDQEKAKLILNALREIEERYLRGDFSVDSERGAQLTLEKGIIDTAGSDAGLSVHTARSRNDQVMVTEMYFNRGKILELINELIDVQKQFLRLAEEHQVTPMPGYTHMQPGKPTTFAIWCLAFFDAFSRGIESLFFTLDKYNLSPLGSVESFGTSWPIDRKLTAKYLGFNEPWEVTLDAISHRGVFQLSILGALSELSISLGKVATDLMLYSTFEYGLIDFGDDVAQRMHPQTGSSVMPQKRNPDALELIRGSAPQIASAYHAAYGILSGLPSGYNRDSREVKEYIQVGLIKTKSSILALEKVLNTLVVLKERMLYLVENNYSLTTDLADYLSQTTKLPYRLVYKISGMGVDYCIKNSLPLQKLSANKLIEIGKGLGVELKIDDQMIKKALDLTEVFERRKHIGGTNKVVVGKMISERGKKIEVLNKELEKRLKIIENSKIELDKGVKAILSA